MEKLSKLVPSPALKNFGGVLLRHFVLGLWSVFIMFVSAVLLLFIERAIFEMLN